MPRHLWQFLFISAVAILSGCVEDVSNSPNFSAFQRTVWRTKVPIALPAFGSGLKSRESTLEYEAEFKRGSASPYCIGDGIKTAAVLPAGTTIRIERLLSIISEEGGTYVECSIQSGPYTGKTFRAPDSLFLPNQFLDNPSARPPSDTWAADPDKLEK